MLNYNTAIKVGTNVMAGAVVYYCVPKVVGAIKNNLKKAKIEKTTEID